jgi:glycosyltransferase involved in cell wall biosynthesis
MKISVITPSFNQGTFIDRTIRSVLTQTLEHQEDSFDYVVCDGGSQDQTLDILADYHDRFALFRYYSEPDRGQAHAVNKGIEKTDGDIIAWLNSDDFYYPQTFQRVLSYFRANPQILVIYGQANHVDENDRFLEAYPVEPWNYKRLIQTCFICQPAVFFKRSVVEHCGALNESFQYAMDYEFWLRCGKEIDFLYVSQVLAASRLYATTKTLSNRPAVFYESSQAVKLHRGRIPDRWLLGHAFVVAAEQVAREQSIESTGYDRIFFRAFLRASLKNFKNWRQLPTPWGIGKLLYWFIRCYFQICPESDKIAKAR